MTSEPRWRVGVVGAGTMGSGIAVVTARAGLPTVLYDIDPARVASGIGTATSFLRRSEQLGKLSSTEATWAVANLVGATTIDDLAAADVVIEAAFERLVVKQQLLTDLDNVVAPSALVHTNTSTLSVTAIAAGSSRPERVVGTHYCNPAPLMKLVEVVGGRRTSDEAFHQTLQFLDAIGKATVTAKDSPGFIVNRFLIPLENHAIRLLEAGVGTVETIDRALTRGLGYPMGPFELLDIVGLDLHREVSMRLYEQLREPRFAPPALVDRMVAAGDLGRKAGRGFYTYDDARMFGT
jgi:3-hydroxybutyryl-CoA dehydrogenase